MADEVVTEPEKKAEPAPTPGVDPAEYARLRARLAELETGEAARTAEKAAADEKKVAAAGQVEKVQEFYQRKLDEAEKRHKDLDARTRGAERGKSISEALAGKGLSYPEAAEDLRKLWADDFEVVDGPDGGFLTRCKATARPASVVIAERLASPRYANYVLATSKGGGGAGGGSGTTPTPGGAGSRPRNALEWVQAQQQAAAAKQRAEGAPRGLLG